MNKETGEAMKNEAGAETKKYLNWANAGGPNECKHGYAEGIPCPKCESGVPTPIPTPATEEGGEPDIMEIEEGFTMLPKITPSSETSDYLRGKLDGLKIENDRLQTSNAAMRRRLDDIANQYAVDCL